MDKGDGDEQSQVAVASKSSIILFWNDFSSKHVFEFNTTDSHMFCLWLRNLIRMFDITLGWGHHVALQQKQVNWR